jgi:hypothetical protein
MDSTSVTVVADPPWLRWLYWVGFPIAGAVLLLLLKGAASWVASLAWAPFQGLFRLVSTIPEPPATLGALAIGVLAGLALGFVAVQDSLTVTLEDDQVTLTRGDSTNSFARAAVHSVFFDAKQLVLLGHATEELAREKSDLEETGLQNAFREHGYTWLPDGDPHREDFRRWIEDHPDVPPAANALLKARERALEKDEKADVTDLRADLAKIGVVVRDEKKHQFWRPLS